MVVEVVIPMNGAKEVSSAVSSGYTSAADTVASLPPTSDASSAASAASSDVEEEKPTLRKRNGRPSIVISDDESEHEIKSKAKPAKSKGKGKFKKPTKKAVESSDYEMSGSAAESDAPSADEEESDAQSFVEESDEDLPKKKSRAKKPTKPAKKAPSRKRKMASSDVEMDMDDDNAGAKGKGKKRKSDAAAENPAKKRKLREDADPWKLETSAVRKDWKQMRSPPLEMFHFERLVIDEYTYLNGKILSMVSKLTASRRWVLSGTPPIHDFASLKTIAAFLDIHLGIDDDGEGQSEQVKKRRREQTGTHPPETGSLLTY